MALPVISPANHLAASRLRGGTFPHMGPLDAAVWRAALKAGLLQADRYEYDVRLGGAGAGQIPDHDDHKPMWASLLAKRVDVIAWKGNSPWVTEVKPVASFAALGQALGYCWLWTKEKGTGAKPVPCVVCAYADPDLTGCYEALGVKLLVLPEADVPEKLLNPTGHLRPM